MKIYKIIFLSLFILICPDKIFASDHDASKFEYTILRTVTFQGSQKGLVISDDFERVETTIYISESSIHILNSYFTFRLKALKNTINDRVIMISCIDTNTGKKFDFTMAIPQKNDKKTMAIITDNDGDGFCFEAFFN